MKQSLILTGATGLVGSRFVELYGGEFEIHNLDLATGVDITVLGQVEDFLTAHPSDALIHLAAFTDTAKAEADKDNKNGICYRVNVEGTKNIAEVCRRHQLFLIHVSTDFVFDGTKRGPYLESDPRSPLGWYGQTKALAEEVVEQSGVNAAIARLSYPYRANFALKPDLIQKMITGLANQTLPPQFSDTLITPTFVDDIAAGFAALLAERSRGIYHLTGGISLSPYDLAKAVAQTFGYDPALVREGDLQSYLASNPRPFAVNGTMSNVQTVASLGLSFVGIETGLSKLKTQQL